MDDLQVTTDGDLTVLKPIGKLDGDTVYHFGEAVEGVRGDVAVDLSETAYISSCGLGCLMRLQMACGVRGAKLWLFGMQQAVRNVMKSTYLLDFFKIVADLEAVKELRK